MMCEENADMAAKIRNFKVVYFYRCGMTAPWGVTKYATALSQNGADVQIFELKPTNYHIPITGLFEGNIPVRSWKYNRYSHRLKKMLVFFAMIAAKADCYITGDPTLIGLTSMAAKINRSRLVYIPFEYFPGLSYATPERRKQYAQMEARHAPNVSAWIALGDFLADEYRKAYDLGDRIHVVYSSWPTEHEFPKPVLRNKLSLDRSHRVILYLGSISVKRGLLNVVSALKKLPGNVIFVILGYGPDVELVRQKAIDEGVNDKVRIMDAVPQTEMLAYTRDAEIGIIPILNVCRSYYFCNPGKLFEYMAAGLPLAVSNLAQLEWFVRKHNLGVVFDPENPDDIASSLLRLLEDDRFRENCAANSRNTHLTEICWEIQSRKLCDAVFGNLFNSLYEEEK